MPNINGLMDNRYLFQCGTQCGQPYRNLHAFLRLFVSQSLVKVEFHSSIYHLTIAGNLGCHSPIMW